MYQIASAAMTRTVLGFNDGETYTAVDFPVTSTFCIILGYVFATDDEGLLNLNYKVAEGLKEYLRNPISDCLMIFKAFYRNRHVLL